MLDLGPKRQKDVVELTWCLVQEDPIHSQKPDFTRVLAARAVREGQLGEEECARVEDLPALPFAGTHRYFGIQLTIDQGDVTDHARVESTLLDVAGPMLVVFFNLHVRSAKGC